MINEIVSDSSRQKSKDLPRVPNVRDEDMVPTSTLYANGTCREDPTLSTTSVQNQRVMIAAMLYNNEKLLPHWIAELLNLIGTLGRDNVFVSLVESGSTDQTGIWLRWLQRILLALDIPHFVVADGPSRVDKIRIRHLARLRNLGMAPVQMAIDNHDWMEWEFLKRFVTTRVAESAVNIDTVLWINDVYWCKEEALRLLAHDADIACASDFDRPEEGWHFYDGWVARDASGDVVTAFNAIDSRFFFRNSAMDNRWKKGLPVQMASCWNGMVSMNAEAFRQGATFSAGTDGVDCRSASEERICGEFIFLGFSRILMDPSVRVTYERSEYNLYSATSLPTFVPWGEISLEKNKLIYDPEAGKQRMCCPLTASIDNYEHDERHVDMRSNCCRLPLWPTRLIRERGTTWNFRTYQSRIMDLIHSSLPIISGYSHIISSKEEAIGALDELHGRLSRANHKDFRLKKKYNKAVSKLQLFGNQTCNGHWLSNDFELSLASIKNQRHNARTIEWSFDVLRRP